MEKALKEKLLEEVNEFIESDQIEEIADILEVIEAIAKLRGVHMALIAGMKEEKKEERGGFEKGCSWSGWRILKQMAGVWKAGDECSGQI